jgi:hypothetical protein
MDWLGTNNSTKTNTVPPVGSIGEVTPEMIVHVCNATQKHAWVNIPHMATDAFVSQFISRLSGLDPKLKIYVEHSNEVWNSIFTQSRYCEEQGVARNLDPNRWLAGMYYHALRTVAIGNAFKQAFGTARVSTVLGAFAANDWFTDNMLRYPGIASGVDVLAIAPYFGQYTDKTTVDAIIADIPGMIEAARGYIRNTKRHVDRYPNIKIAAYEGGQHILISGHNDALTPVLKAVNSDPRMGQYYTQYLNMWRQETNDGLFVHFVNTSKWSKWGCWGSMQNQAHTNSPKYLALRQFAGL